MTRLSWRTLSDDLQLNGLWWVPENPENQVPGIVSFNDEGINLEVFGVLQEPTGSNTDMDPLIILGRAQGGSVTLHRALATEYPATRFGAGDSDKPRELRRSTFSILNMFVGVHFGSEAEISFTSWEASFTHLEEWVGPERIPFKSDEDAETYTATYSYPDEIRMKIRALESEISVGSQFINTAPGFRTMRLEHDALISISPDEQRNLDWYQAALRNCQDLLTLLVGMPVHPRWIKAHVEGENRTATPYGTIQGSVEVISYEHSIQLRRKPPPPWHWRWDKVLVPLTTVEANFEQVLNAWFDRADLLEPVYTLFFSTLYDPDTYLTSEFLSLAQALEIFHRRITPEGHDRYFPKETFKEYREAMLSVLPEKARSVLSSRLQFMNEYSLKERLEDLAMRVPNAPRALISRDLNEFIKRVRDTRNYLTHYTKRKKAFTEDEYFGANSRLRLWLMVLLLLEVGVDQDVVSEASEKFRELHIPHGDLS